MNLRSHDLNLLPVFDALMREQHLTRAADLLAMSQPAVSSALKRLRLSFSDALFVRTANGLKPTPRALEIHGMIQPALQLIQSGYTEQQFDPATSDKALKMSMNAAAEYLMGGPLMTWLRKQAPELRIELCPDHLHDIPRSLKEGQLDFAIDYLGFEDPNFKQTCLVEEELTVIASANHTRLKGAISLKQFESLPQVSLVSRSSLVHGQLHLRGTPIEQLMGSDLPHRNIKMQVSSFVSIPDIVEATDLIAIVPKRIAETYHRRDRLQLLELPFDYPVVNIYLLWHKSRERDPLHQWFREQLLALVSLL